MDLYEEYCAASVDYEQLGMMPQKRESTYFCTPLDADVLGWTGVDGVHFCRVKGYGETVFCISPMNLPGEYVHPVAKNFRDFLRLILACRGTAAIEQMYAWTKDAFDAFLSEDQPDLSRQAALAAVSNAFSLEAMEDPYGYVKGLQKGFDLTGLRFSEDYDEWAPPVTKPQPWKVTFAGGFDHHVGRGGKEIAVNQSFLWGDVRWHVPAVYACAEGLVVDILAQGDAERVQEYVQKAAKLDGCDGASRAAVDALERENPLDHRFSLSAVLNGAVLTQRAQESIYHLPQWLLREDVSCDGSAKLAVTHYGMDIDSPWSLYRCKFNWNTGKKPRIRSLSLTFVQGKQIIPGPCFEVKDAGREVELIHPLTGAAHRIYVEALVPLELDLPRRLLPGALLPNRCWTMRYRITPNIPRGNFHLRDTLPDEEPRSTEASTGVRSDTEAAAIGIIGGADGPTAMFLSCGSGQEERWANSSLRFSLPESIKWQVEFLEKTLQDYVLKIK